MGWFDNAEDDEKEIIYGGTEEETAVAEPKKDPASLWSEYDRMSKDNSEIDEVADSVSKRNNITNMFQGLSQIFAGRKNTDNSLYDNIRNSNNSKLTDAKAAKKQRMADMVATDQIQRTDVERGQKDAKFKQESDENDALTSAASPRSNLYQNMARAKLREKARLATEAGDAAGAAHFKTIEESIGDKSAADIGKMGLLDGDGYSTIINNKKADARAAHQDAGEERRNRNVTLKLEADMRALVSKDPIMKEAAKGYMGLKSASKMIAADNGIADEALLVSWQKGMDPLSVVRESEFARTTDGAGLMRKVEIMVDQAVTGKRLTPELRKQISAAMGELQGKYEDYTRSVMDIVESNIASNNLNRENIYGQFHKDLSGMSRAAPAATTAPAAPQSKPKTVVQGGVTYILNEATGEYE